MHSGSKRAKTGLMIWSWTRGRFVRNNVNSCRTDRPRHTEEDPEMYELENNLSKPQRRGTALVRVLSDDWNAGTRSDVHVLVRCKLRCFNRSGQSQAGSELD